MLIKIPDKSRAARCWQSSRQGKPKSKMSGWQPDFHPKKNAAQEVHSNNFLKWEMAGRRL
jgi:hypothetical protein